MKDTETPHLRHRWHDGALFIDTAKKIQWRLQWCKCGKENCETCHGLGRVDAVYAHCPNCVLTAAREELTAVTEQRDRLAEECAKIRDVAERAIDYLDQSYRDGFSTEVSELRYELAAVKGWSDES